MFPSNSLEIFFFYFSEARPLWSRAWHKIWPWPHRTICLPLWMWVHTKDSWHHFWKWPSLIQLGSSQTCPSLCWTLSEPHWRMRSWQWVTEKCVKNYLNRSQNSFERRNYDLYMTPWVICLKIKSLFPVSCLVLVYSTIFSWSVQICHSWDCVCVFL